MNANMNLIVVRGAGDLATGVIVRLTRAGYRVLALEVAAPTAIRRTVSLSEAVFQGTAMVEGVTARLATGIDALGAIFDAGEVPILVDPDATCLAALRPTALRPAALVDAIIAKRNFGTSRAMAPVTVALGPGFTAGLDVDFVVETNRGHDLGRVIDSGAASPNTGIPGEIAGHSGDRVFRAPAAGILRAHCAIGDRLARGAPILSVGESTILAPFDGVVRGLLRDGSPVHAGLKIADLDPRCAQEHCFSVSDKARAIAGGVLEALMRAGVQPGFMERRRERDDLDLEKINEASTFLNGEAIDSLSYEESPQDHLGDSKSAEYYDQQFARLELYQKLDSARDEIKNGAEGINAREKLNGLL